MLWSNKSQKTRTRKGISASRRSRTSKGCREEHLLSIPARALMGESLASDTACRSGRPAESILSCLPVQSITNEIMRKEETMSMRFVLLYLCLLMLPESHPPSSKRMPCGAICINPYKHCSGQCMIKHGHLRPHCCSGCRYRWTLSPIELATALKARTHRREQEHKKQDV
jgi:hypothetical protein